VLKKNSEKIMSAARLREEKRISADPVLALKK
jgi:hypothetical protein